MSFCLLKVTTQPLVAAESLPRPDWGAGHEADWRARQSPERFHDPRKLVPPSPPIFFGGEGWGEEVPQLIWSFSNAVGPSETRRPPLSGSLLRSGGERVEDLHVGGRDRARQGNTPPYVGGYAIFNGPIFSWVSGRSSGYNESCRVVVNCFSWQLFSPSYTVGALQIFPQEMTCSPTRPSPISASR